MIDHPFKKLQEAIDFFSQSLHIEQLMAYGYELVHRTLDLNASALFMLEDSNYVLQHCKNFEINQFHEPVVPAHKVFAERFGRVLTKDFDRYFSDALVTRFKPCFVMPIIDKDNLAGFIIAGGQCTGALDEALLEFVHAINQLMNKAYENASAYHALEQKNKELDKRVFNLFFINHSARLLMSELQVSQLYSLCVDIVRELTASAVTSFFVVDESHNRLILRGYKNILDFDQRYEELPCPTQLGGILQTVFHIDKDRDALTALLGDLQVLEALKTEYVTFIVREKVLGLITISKPVNNSSYDQAVLDLIVSIANSIYIAMHNALQFQEIEGQRRLLASRVQAMESLNRSVRNIHACQDIEELADIVMQTLKYGFGVTRAALVLGRANEPTVTLAEGFKRHPDLALALRGNLRDKRVAYTAHQAREHLALEHLEGLDDAEGQESINCLMYLPLEMDILTEEGGLWLGGLYIDQLAHPLQPQDELAFETLANTIAPFVYWLDRQKRCDQQHQLQSEHKLLTLLQQAAVQREALQLDYWVMGRPAGDNLGQWLQREKELKSEPDRLIIGSYEVAVVNRQLPGEWAFVIKGEGAEKTYQVLQAITR